MRKILSFFMLFMAFFSASAMDITINESMRGPYRANLAAIISRTPVALDWYKSKLVLIDSELQKTEGSVVDYKKICSETMNVLPSFLGDDERILSKILVFSIFHVLKEGIYDFIGSSFYPKEPDLESIILDGTILTPSEFMRIQTLLEEKLEDGSLDGSSFHAVLGTLVEERHQ